MVRLFTLDQARQTLPLIKGLVHACQVAAAELDGVDPADVEQVTALVGRIHGARTAIEHLGATLKSVPEGVVDWYGEEGGTIGYYCWKVGEQDVEHWHATDQGFSQRQHLAVAVG